MCFHILGWLSFLFILKTEKFFNIKNFNINFIFLIINKTIEYLFQEINILDNIYYLM